MILSFPNRPFARAAIVFEQYMIRWPLITEKPFRHLMLHHFTGPDPGRDGHAYPWEFYALVLGGSYIDIGPDRPPEVFTRARRREWGFHAAAGRVPHDDDTDPATDS